MKLSEELDEKVEALTYHSVHRKKWRVINELIAEALEGKQIPPIPKEAREPFEVPAEKPNRKVPGQGRHKAKNK